MQQKYEFQPESNYILISKQGVNSTKNNRGCNLSQLTFKEGEQSVKININSSEDNRISKSNILQTITDYRKKIILLQKNKNNKYHHYKTSTKDKNRQRYRKNKLIDEKNIVSYNSEDAMKDINKIEIANISNNTDDDKKNLENQNIEDKIKPEDTQIIVKNNNSLVLEAKKENEKNDIEEQLVSSINKKSVKTLQVKKELKEMQKSNKAEISKVNSESDNATEFDLKLKSSMKLKKINDNNSYFTGIIGSNINEKEEFENEIIDNHKDIMTILDNNELKQGVSSTKRNLDNNDSNNELRKLKIKNNNFINNNIKNVEQSSIIENSDGNDLIDDNSNNKKDIINNEKEINNIDNDNKNLNDNNLIDDNISENKKLIPILKKNNINKNNLKDLATKALEISDNTIKKKVSINIKDDPKNSLSSTTAVQNLLLNQNNKQNSSLNNLNGNNSENTNRIFFSTYQSIQKDCYICEKSFYFIKLYYAECNQYFLCRKCLKSYYEDYIENNNFSKILKCPCAQCDKTIDYEKIVKDVISDTHQKIYENYNEEKGIIDKYRDVDSNIDTNLKLYTKRHVLDVNNNKKIYMFKKTKERYCPRCLMPYLFSKTNNNFIKCLFCNFKICKFCLKEYSHKHLNLQNEDHCKIRYRRNLDEQEKTNPIIKYLIEVFFVMVTYLLIFPGMFLTFLNILNRCFRINKKEKNTKYYIKSIFSWIFCLIFFIICCPIIILIYSMFPVIISIFDY